MLLVLQIAQYEAVALEVKNCYWCYFGLYLELCFQIRTIWLFVTVYCTYHTISGLEFRIKSIDTNYSSLYQCVGINALYLLACGIGILGVERLGRRKLLLSSLAGVVVSLLLIGVMFQQADSQAPSVSHSSWTQCQDRKDYFCKGTVQVLSGFFFVLDILLSSRVSV